MDLNPHILDKHIQIFSGTKQGDDNRHALHRLLKSSGAGFCVWWKISLKAKLQTNLRVAKSVCYPRAEWHASMLRYVLSSRQRPMLTLDFLLRFLSLSLKVSAYTYTLQQTLTDFSELSNTLHAKRRQAHRNSRNIIRTSYGTSWGRLSLGR